jgi:FO synthase
LEQKSAQAGFELKARLPIYPEFIRQADKFIEPSLLRYVEQLCGRDGLIRNNGPLQKFPTFQHTNAPSIPGTA